MKKWGICAGIIFLLPLLGGTARKKTEEAYPNYVSPSAKPPEDPPY